MLYPKNNKTHQTFERKETTTKFGDPRPNPPPSVQKYAIFGGCFMISEGLRDMFEGDFAEMYTNKFLLMSIENRETLLSMCRERARTVISL